jgi:hypothetical protein
MPQFVPFYFINQISSVYFFLIIFIYILYRYLLPNTLILLLTRFALLNRIK